MINKYLSVCVLLLISFIFTGVVVGQTNISVSMQIGEPYGSLIVEGQAPPLSTVTILIDSNIVGTVMSDIDGNFSKEVTSLEPDIIDVSLYYQTPNGEISPTIHQQLAIISGTQIRLYNLVLPPTINAKYLKDTKTIYVYGYAVRGSTVVVFTDKLADSFQSIASDTGKWSVSFDVSSKKLSKLKVYARSTDSSGKQSKQSQTITVTVKNDYISEIVDSIPNNLIRDVVERFFNPLSVLYSEFDLNKDGVITKDEAFNVVKTWTGSWRGSDGSCDLNNDTKCNIVDFSIMLFYIDRR